MCIFAGMTTEQIIALMAARRKELGISYRKLGEKSGVYYSHISDIEHGRKTHIEVNTLLMLLDALDLSLSIQPKEKSPTKQG